jgi:hypothetical protein
MTKVKRMMSTIDFHNEGGVLWLLLSCEAGMVNNNSTVFWILARMGNGSEKGSQIFRRTIGLQFVGRTHHESNY